MSSVLTRNEIGASFTLLAWREMSLAAEPGLKVHVHSGVLRVRAGACRSPQVVRAGGHFVTHRDGLVELKARAHAELRIEWPERGLERLSPGLEPVSMELPAQALRP